MNRDVATWAGNCFSGWFPNARCVVNAYICQSKITLNNRVSFNYRSWKGQGPPLWPRGQSFWLHIQRSRVRFPALPDYLRRRVLKRDPLSLARTTEELLE
jgi:hypothetical protein